MENRSQTNVENYRITHIGFIFFFQTKSKGLKAEIVVFIQWKTLDEEPKLKYALEEGSLGCQ